MNRSFWISLLIIGNLCASEGNAFPGGDSLRDCAAVLSDDSELPVIVASPNDIAAIDAAAEEVVLLERSSVGEDANPFVDDRIPTAGEIVRAVTSAKARCDARTSRPRVRKFTAGDHGADDDATVTILTQTRERHRQGGESAGRGHRRGARVVGRLSSSRTSMHVRKSESDSSEDNVRPRAGGFVSNMRAFINRTRKGGGYAAAPEGQAMAVGSLRVVSRPEKTAVESVILPDVVAVSAAPAPAPGSRMRPLWCEDSGESTSSEGEESDAEERKHPIRRRINPEHVKILHALAAARGRQERRAHEERACSIAADRAPQSSLHWARQLAAAAASPVMTVPTNGSTVSGSRRVCLLPLPGGSRRVIPVSGARSPVGSTTPSVTSLNTKHVVSDSGHVRLPALAPDSTAMSDFEPRVPVRSGRATFKRNANS